MTYFCAWNDGSLPIQASISDQPLSRRYARPIGTTAPSYDDGLAVTGGCRTTSSRQTLDISQSSNNLARVELWKQNTHDEEIG
jgi:hypothetical protein